jgi:hypothetical protein
MYFSIFFSQQNNVFCLILRQLVDSKQKSLWSNFSSLISMDLFLPPTDLHGTPGNSRDRKCPSMYS